MKVGASPKVWPSVWPIGRPLALSFLPTSRYFSQVSGNLRDADLLEPRLAVGDHAADHGPRHATCTSCRRCRSPWRADSSRLRALPTSSATSRHVDDAGGIEMRVVVERHDQVGTGARLDGGGDARLQVVAVDRLEVDLDAERLLGLRQHFLAQQLIGGRNEVVPAQPVHGRGLRVGGRPAGRQDAGHAAGLCGQRTSAPDTFRNLRREMCDIAWSSRIYCY